MSPIVYIETVSDWLEIIRSRRTVVTTFILLNNLTFTFDARFYINEGTADSDFFYVGPGDIFDGNGYVLSITYSPPAGMNGIFRCSGSNDTYAVIQNTEVYIASDVYYDEYQGALLIGNYFNQDPLQEIIPKNISLSNLIIRSDCTVQVTQFFVAILLNSQSGIPSNVNMDSVCIFSTAVQQPINTIAYQLEGLVSVTNCFMYINTSVSIIYSLTGNQSINFSNNYIVYQQPPPSPIDACIIATVTMAITSTLTISNVYSVFLTEGSITPVEGTSLIFITSSTITVNNYVTNSNLDTFIYVSDSGRDKVSTVDCVNNFTWDTPPDPDNFSSVFFNKENLPFRLQSFLAPSIYDPSAYETYISIPKLLHTIDPPPPPPGPTGGTSYYYVDRDSLWIGIPIRK